MKNCNKTAFFSSIKYSRLLFIKIIINQKTMREDNQMLVMTHLSQLLDLITGIGGFIVPLILWLTQKDKVAGMDMHGKMILNFQISLILYSIVAIPLILLLGLGIILIILIAIVALIFPIINAIKVSNGELPSYPLSIAFIK